MLRRLSILTVVALATLAVACSGDGGNANDEGQPTPIVIEPLDLSDVDLNITDSFDPNFPNPYPDVVATVNGEPISSQMLVQMQINAELKRRDISTLDGPLQMAAAVGLDDDPLEVLINQSLLDQAVVRLGYLPSYEEGVQWAQYWEEQSKSIEGTGQSESGVTSRELFAGQGLNYDDWASNPELVEYYRQIYGVSALEHGECTTYLEPPNEDVVSGSDCTDFLAKERENADIVYFVRWAD